MKWAQLTKEQRAYRKMVQANEKVALCVFFKKRLTIEEQRRMNRYTQLSKHWLKLHKEATAQSTK